jgi:hypothetical protein
MFTGEATGNTYRVVDITGLTKDQIEALLNTQFIAGYKLVVGVGNELTLVKVSI